MSKDDKVRENPAREERAIGGDSDARADWKEAFLRSRDRRPSEKAAVALSDVMTALLGDMVAELENLGGISAPRLHAILRGEAVTNGELEEIGYVCVELLRELKELPTFGPETTTAPGPSSTPCSVLPRTP